jgi:hypothetical protein
MTAGPVEYTMAGKEALLHVDHDHPDYEAFHEAMVTEVEQTPERVLELREEIAQLAAPHHAFEVIYAVWATYSVVYGEKLRPLGDGPTRIPEYIAHVLLDRDNPEPLREPSDEERLRGVNPEALGELAKKIFSLLPVWFTHRQEENPLDEDPWLELRSRFYMHRLLLTSFTYEWQERETLCQLFGDFETELRSQLGFGVEEGIALLEALTTLPRERAGAHGRAARHLAEEYLAEATKTRESQGKPDDPLVMRLCEVPKEEAEEWMHSVAISWMSADIGRAASFTAGELAERAQVEEGAAAGFLAAFSVDFGARSDQERWKLDPARAIGGEMETMRDRPILHDGAGHYLPAAVDTVFYGLRDVLTEALKQSPKAWRRYERGRGRLVERRAVEAFTSGLEADWAHAGVKYRYVDEDGVEREGEVDGVLRAGTIVVLVEAKAGSLAPSARRTAPERLERGLRDLVVDAHDQLSRAQLALVGGSATQICDASGAPLELDLDRVTRVLRVAVSLEELAPLAPAIWQLQATGLLPREEQIPWVLGIHELELICELVESPAQLIHYMLRRQRTIRQRIWAMDELDFFVKYLDDGLYFEDEQLEEVRAEVHSYTDRLDEYLYGRQGLRASTPPLRQKIDSKTQALLRRLGELDSPARLEAQLMVLEMDERSRRRFSSGLRQIANKTARDGKPHDLSLFFEGSFGVTAHCVPRELAGTLRERLERHGKARRQRSNLPRWVGIGLVPENHGEIIGMSVMTDSDGLDPE